jgi:hypothetical protein
MGGARRRALAPRDLAVDALAVEAGERQALPERERVLRQGVDSAPRGYVKASAVGDRP